MWKILTKMDYEIELSYIFQSSKSCVGDDNVENSN